MQEGISLINYLCTTDDVMKLSEKLFEFRGPVVISKVINKVILSNDNNTGYFNSYSDTDGGIDLRRDELKGMEALSDFLEIKTTIKEQIKIIKEPITSI